MRAVVVLGRDGELAVALRERLDAAGTDPLAVIGSCAPWPWMLVGQGPQAGEPLTAWLRPRPVLVRWLGALPDGLPGHARASARFGDLATSVTRALAADVAGVRLAVGAGVQVDGTVHVNPELEALLCESPAAFDLPRARFRRAEALVARSIPRLRVTSTVTGVALAAA